MKHFRENVKFCGKSIYERYITGFRRVGKTYMLYEAIEKLLKTFSREDVVYANFEDERILAPSTELLTDLIL